jgi:hypothetical protein
MSINRLTVLLVVTLAIISAAAGSSAALRGAILKEPEATKTEEVTTWTRRLYNAFKSYANEPLEDRPPQYSRKGIRTHPISEYLTPGQKRMKENRNSNAVAKKDQFDSSWSGHKTYKEIMAKRKSSLGPTASDKDEAKKEKKAAKQALKLMKKVAVAADTASNAA